MTNTYYQRTKERLQKEARQTYQYLRRKKAQETYQSFTEEENERKRE